MKNERYVIVDKRTTCGNSVFFWCNDSQGYTCDLRMAAVLTLDECKEHTRRDTDVFVKYADCLKLVQHHVDCQDLYREPRPKNAHTFSHIEVKHD